MSGSHMSISDLPSNEDDDRQAAARARRKRRVRRRRRSTIVLLTCLALVAGAAYAVYTVARPAVEGFFAGDDYEGPGTGAVHVQVQAGDSGRAIGETLVEAGVVKTAEAFVRSAADEPRAASIQPGTYRLQERMPASDALNLLLDPTSRVSLGIAVPEGLSVDQVFERLSRGSGVPVEEFRRAATDPALSLPPEAGGNPEGYLFPATYEFEPSATAVEMLAAMVQRHNAAIDAVGVPPARRREVLIKASLVEDEAQLPADFPRVARVFDNRLANGMPLQLDSTVNFATGKTGITTTAQDRATDSPYNTYLYAGLPPGPINSPGEQAMAAVLNPPEGDWLYFVAVNPETGETRFASTLEEHNANVELFRQWLAENGGG
jgi:UPF0755 protein